MSIVYLLQNQHDQYLSKAGEWLEGDAASALYRTEHKDEAINRKVEFTVKNVELRIAIVKASLRENGTPELSSIVKNEEDKTQINNNHGPLFDGSSPEDSQPNQTQDSEIAETAAENTETTEKKASSDISKPEEQNSEENIYTAEPQDDNHQEGPTLNADEVREAI